MSILALLLFLVQDAADLKKTLAREILGPKTSLEEIQDFIERSFASASSATLI